MKRQTAILVILASPLIAFGVVTLGWIAVTRYHEFMMSIGFSGMGADVASFAIVLLTLMIAWVTLMIHLFHKPK